MTNPENMQSIFAECFIDFHDFPEQIRKSCDGSHVCVTPYQVWLQKVQWFKRYNPDKQFIEILNVCSDLDLDRSHSNPTFSLDILAYDDQT